MKRPRRIRAWKVLCWLVIGIGVTGWIRGVWKYDLLQYRMGRLIAPAAEPPGQDWWMFSTRTYCVTLTRGSITLSVGDYDSMGPEPGELAGRWSGSLGFAARSGPAPTGPALQWLDWSWPDRAIVLGVGIVNTSSTGNRILAAAAPLALPITLAAVPLLISWRRQHRLKRRFSQGRCTHCGYQRNGLTQDQPCPECGRAEASSLRQQV